MSDSIPGATAVALDARRLLWLTFLGWLGVELLFVGLDTVVNYNRLTGISQFRRMANIAREDGLATWFSSVQLLLVGMVAAAAGWRVRLDGARGRTWAWLLVALFFCYMAFDDGAKVHERVATGVKKLVAGEGQDTYEVFSFFPSYAWQLLFGPLFAGMGLFMAGFFWRELRTMRMRLMVLSALGCWVIAVGLDFIEGLDHGYDEIAAWLSVSARFANHYGRVLEESLEMFGTTLFLTAFLKHLTDTWGRLEIRFTTDA